MTNERLYVALASDGDQIRDVSRDEAFEWADEHLSMLENHRPEGVDHWVEVISYRPEFNDSTSDKSSNQN